MKTPIFLVSSLLLTTIFTNVFAQDTKTLQGAVASQDALDLLLEGNQRFISGNLLNPDQTPGVRESLVNNQAPFATVVGCSDSRVPPEVIFDRGLGDLFTMRTAGAVVDPVGMDSIEYSVNHLKTNFILVLGHENCGAVKGVISKSDLEAGDIEYLIPAIEPSVEEARKMSGNLLLNATNVHTHNTVESIKANPKLAAAMANGQLKVVGGYYSLETGKVEILPE